MRSTISIRDVRNGQIEMTTELTEATHLEQQGPPTAATIHLVGALALFHSGVMAQAGAIAIKELEEGRDPTEAVREKFMTND